MEAWQWKKGPFDHYAYVHDKLAQTKSLADTIAAINSLSPQLSDSLPALGHSVRVCSKCLGDHLLLVNAYPRLRRMNDQHVSALCAIWQTVLLALNAVLIGWYLLETQGIRKSSQKQVEASFRPAVIVKHDGSTSSLPELENIGNGPAMDVKWTLLLGFEFRAHGRLLPDRS